MKLGQGTLVITNGQIVDGTGRPAVRDGSLLVQDGMIAYVGPAAQMPAVAPGTPSIDAKGGTILPGLVEAHFHATYFNIAALEDLDIKYPVEYVSMLASVNARLALECGYTSARSGGCLFNIDVNVGFTFIKVIGIDKPFALVKAAAEVEFSHWKCA